MRRVSGRKVLAASSVSLLASQQCKQVRSENPARNVERTKFLRRHCANSMRFRLSELAGTCGRAHFAQISFFSIDLEFKVRKSGSSDCILQNGGSIAVI